MKGLMRALLVASLGALALMCAWLAPYERGAACLLHAPQREALLQALDGLKEEGLSTSAYAVTRAGEVACLGRTLPEATAWEYYSLSREGLHMALVAGRFPEGENEAMLSQEAAQAVDPTLRCVGETISVRGQEYRVTGIFRKRRGSVCALPDLLVPADRTRAYPEVFVCAQAGALLREAEKAIGEEGWVETVDLGALCSTGRQRARLFGAAVACLFSLSLWRREREMRTQSARALQASVYSTPARSLLGGLCAFLGGNWRSWLAILCTGLAVAVCAGQLYLPPDALPAPVYSLSAWRELLAARLQARLTRGAFLTPAVQQARTLLFGIGLAGGTALLSACCVCFAPPGR